MSLARDIAADGLLPVVPEPAARTPRAGSGRRSPSWQLWIGAALMTVWLLSAVLWPLVVPFDPDATNVGPAVAGPGDGHLLGTDDLGRDVFSRVLAGATTVFLVAPAATLLQLVVGLAIGMSAGYFGGRADSVLMRSMDVVIVLPTLILLVIVVRVLGVSTPTLIVVIGLAGVPTFARQARNLTFRLRNRSFVTAARMRGENAAAVIVGELLPNLLPVIAVEAVVRFGWNTLASTSLAFLGLSWQPPSSDWGLTINTERIYLQVQPFTVLGPALALASLVVGAGLVGDALAKKWRSR
ncbi:ABC transporter permease [Herbiconiux daphne]|uniref:ABC transporter permease n=1 Tax=Herbiconiux daphne TaxID=2970914 RepID=A0ABT2H6X8_9MICO|nr:ABC transporter permease [Herbiconiux daphne]MCS5735657.1 ABC transporter permease [Herbiconiux daphne]